MLPAEWRPAPWTGDDAMTAAESLYDWWEACIPWWATLIPLAGVLGVLSAYGAVLHG